jgi:hypothetical protein
VAHEYDTAERDLERAGMALSCNRHADQLFTTGSKQIVLVGEAKATTTL